MCVCVCACVFACVMWVVVLRAHIRADLFVLFPFEALVVPCTPRSKCYIINIILKIVTFGLGLPKKKVLLY